MYKTFLILLLFVPSISAQQFEHAGIQSYKKGNYREAARLLEAAVKENGFSSDAMIWNYLGLAYLQLNDYKDARKSLEKATKLAPDNSNFHANLSYAYLSSKNIKKAESEGDKAVARDPKNGWAYYIRGSARLWGNKLDDAKKDADQMIAVDPVDPRGYVLTSYVLMDKLSQKIGLDEEQSVRDNIHFLKEAKDVLEKGAEVCKANPHKDKIDDELESVSAFYEHFSKTPVPPVQPNVLDPTVTPLVITLKPRPSYTDDARQSNVQGIIKLAVLFGSDSKVQHILVLKRLGHGLDAEAVMAAGKMKFTPKMKDGKPVSVVRIVEFSFTIY